MVDEHNALHQNNMWTLVPWSDKMNVVSCPWIFRIKEKSNGDIQRYEACLQPHLHPRR